MLESSLRRILHSLGPDDVVLDIGAWAKPFTRANWVMDLRPYESRGVYGLDGPEPERFTADTWIRRDICDREPYPFDDGQIDFVSCSHTLEDIRDPLWVCSEMTRIARAGYIEIPSRLEEQTYGVEGPWVGRAHHRWLIDQQSGGLSFTFKSHILHRRLECHFPYGFDSQLRPDQLVQTFWWEDAFPVSERFFADPAEHDRYMSDFVDREKQGRYVPNRTLEHARLILDRLGLRGWGRRRSPA